MILDGIYVGVARLNLLLGFGFLLLFLWRNEKIASTATSRNMSNFNLFVITYINFYDHEIF